MKPNLKTYNIVAALAIFVALPILLYAFGEFPRRNILKEAISILTIVAFSLMLGQFFLARSNLMVIELYSRRHVQLVHKVIAYSVVAVFLLHPFLIVLPRYFEAGVDPVDALVTMLTTFESLGIALGMIAWVLLLVLAVTAMFSRQIIKQLGIKYQNWRYFHGFLSVGLTTIAIFHATELGRHTDAAMAAFMIVVAAGGMVLLFRMYLASIANPAGAK